MTDWSGCPQGIDVSHYQGQPDWPRVLASGMADFVVIKCLESGSLDSEFERNRKALTDAGALWLPYVFLRPGDGEDTISRFCVEIGQEMPVALDWEATGVTAFVVDNWIQGVADELGQQPLIYWGLYPPVTPSGLITACPRWYPQYPGSASADPSLPPWTGQTAPPADWSNNWLIWQWSDNGTVPGISDNEVDLNRLGCSLDVFRQWYETGFFPDDLSPSAPPVAPLPIDRTLSLHSSGPDVAALQQALNWLDCPCGPADGIFGPNTQDAVLLFQGDAQLTPDGIVGPATLAALNAALLSADG